MHDCLALTGTDDLLPILIAAAALMVGGVVALFIAKRRAGWAALAILPLLIGASLLGAGAPPAQAASACGTAPVTHASTPACTPGLPAEDIVVEDANWRPRSTGGFDGWIQDLPDATAQQIAALLALSTDPTPPAAIVGDVSIVVTPQDIETTSTDINADVVRDGSGSDVGLSTDNDYLYIPFDPVRSSVSVLGIQDFFITDLSATITVPQSDGCGGTVSSTIKFSGNIPPPA